jgi:peptidoglycan hydrolase-like protein with peptidoglycan-binding domain
MIRPRFHKQGVRSMFNSHVELEIRTVAAERGVEAAALLAVAEVESGGQALADVGGRPMPLILYEFHVFHRQLRPAARPAAVAAGLAKPRWGMTPYPRSQRERYALLERAKLIDSEAAYAACSWGVGQVLGENARWLDYESAEALAQEAMSGVAGQVRLMMRFIERRGLRNALADCDWTAFAHGYNGPLHYRHDYAGRMAAAYTAWAGRDPARTGRPVLSIGARGDAVVELQLALTRLGFAADPDGVFGPATRSAVRAFQSEDGLVRDGVVGQRTWARLDARLQALNTRAEVEDGPSPAADAQPAEPNTRTPAVPPAPRPMRLTKAAAQDATATSLGLILRQGDAGPQVRALQWALIARGEPLRSDGAFGPATAAALRRFQTRAGLTVDGVAGPAVWRALGLEDMVAA